MSVWLIMGGAVLLLAAILAGLGHWARVWDLLWFMRGDDEATVAVSVRGETDVHEESGAERASIRAGTDGPDVVHLQVPELPPLAPDESEPEDGDAYAAELHAIGEAAAADVLELHLAWYPGRMPAWFPAAGGTLEQWQRCYRWKNRSYWAARRREWVGESQAWWADYREWRAEMGLAA